MKRKIAIILGAAVLLSGCSLTGIFSKKFAALQITASPKAEVYLNDKKAGETPFKSEKLKSQDYQIKLVPKGEGLSEFETAVTLQPNITTIINYTFNQDRDKNTGYVLTLEPIADENAQEIAIVSIPDNASIKLDGQPKGFTPLQLKSITAGDHTLSISAPGYKQQSIDIKTIAGHKLTIDTQLAKETLLTEEKPTDEESEKEDSEEEESDEDQKPTPTPRSTKSASPSANLKPPYVEILDTPTGWLRVRSEASTATDNEIAKINPGETYKYLESNDTGWHKIELDDGQEGWISGRYAKVVK